ncbi:MAG: Gx transporter family protein [Lachnospiraceae bacterium]|nr:Gx transporter family protein [Lachnospiraceae bacterium]
MEAGKNKSYSYIENNGNKRVALLAMLTALAILIGYVESLIPLNFSIPGVKLGLCNIVILITLIMFSWKEALLVSIIRILVVGLLFGNVFSIAYSMAGALLALCIMALLLRIDRFGMIGISASGGASHGIGQLLVAKAVLPALPFAGYASILIFTGLLTGCVVGLITYEIHKRLLNLMI